MSQDKLKEMVKIPVQSENNKHFTYIRMILIHLQLQAECVLLMVHALLVAQFPFLSLYQIKKEHLVQDSQSYSNLYYLSLSQIPQKNFDTV